MIEIIDQFSVQGAIKSYERLERGHINDTFKVVTTDQEYLFQKINHKIFKDVSGMMGNIQRITKHLPLAYDRLGITSQETLRLIKTHRLENFVYHEEGYFRMFDFKSHLKSLDVPESEEQIFEGAKSYGFFLRALNDFNPSDLSVTLADFHNLDYRIRNFKEAKAKIKNVKTHELEAFENTKLYPDVAENCMSTSFSHIFQGGYSSGYYSYKWAEVLDADAFEYFKEAGIFNKEVATKFKDIVLSQGGTEDPMVLYKRFRGQEPQPEALLKRAGLLK